MALKYLLCQQIQPMLAKTVFSVLLIKFGEHMKNNLFWYSNAKMPSQYEKWFCKKKSREILGRERCYSCWNLHLLSANYGSDSVLLYINTLFNIYAILVKYHHENLHTVNLRVIKSVLATERTGIQINLTVKHNLLPYTMPSGSWICIHFDLHGV